MTLLALAITPPVGATCGSPSGNHPFDWAMDMESCVDPADNAYDTPSSMHWGDGTSSDPHENQTLCGSFVSRSFGKTYSFAGCYTDEDTSVPSREMTTPILNDPGEVSFPLDWECPGTNLAWSWWEVVDADIDFDEKFNWIHFDPGDLIVFKYGANCVWEQVGCTYVNRCRDAWKGGADQTDWPEWCFCDEADPISSCSPAVSPGTYSSEDLFGSSPPVSDLWLQQDNDRFCGFDADIGDQHTGHTGFIVDKDVVGGFEYDPTSQTFTTDMEAESDWGSWTLNWGRPPISSSDPADLEAHWVDRFPPAVDPETPFNVVEVVVVNSALNATTSSVPEGASLRKFGLVYQSGVLRGWLWGPGAFSTFDPNDHMVHWMDRDPVRVGEWQDPDEVLDGECEP